MTFDLESPDQRQGITWLRKDQNKKDTTEQYNYDILVTWKDKNGHVSFSNKTY